VAGGAFAYAVFAYEVVIRYLLGTTSFYANRIPFGGMAGLLAAPFAHPGRFLNYLRSGYKPFYVWQMAASFGGAFLIAPEIAAVGVLTLGENVLSAFPYMQQIRYHYSLALVPVLAMGTVFAIGAIRSSTVKGAATTYVVGAAVVACFLWGLAPFSRHPVYPHSPPDGQAVLAVNQALRVIPPGAVVSADDFYVSHLDHRVYCYQWPTPFRAEYWHLYTQEGQRLPFAGRVQYLVIPSSLSSDSARTFAAIAPQFRLVASGGGVDVFKRVAPAPG
jgi:uncharacterized membrane protein